MGLGEGGGWPLFPSEKRRMLFSASRGPEVLLADCPQLSAITAGSRFQEEPSALWEKHLGNTEELLRVWSNRNSSTQLMGG